MSRQIRLAATFADMLQNFQLANQTLFIAVMLLVIGMIGLIARRGPIRRALSLAILANGLLLIVAGLHSLVAESVVRQFSWVLLLCMAAMLVFVLTSWRTQTFVSDESHELGSQPRRHTTKPLESPSPPQTAGRVVVDGEDMPNGEESS